MKLRLGILGIVRQAVCLPPPGKDEFTLLISLSQSVPGAGKFFLWLIVELLHQNQGGSWYRQVPNGTYRMQNRINPVLLNYVPFGAGTIQRRTCDGFIFLNEYRRVLSLPKGQPIERAKLIGRPLFMVHWILERNRTVKCDCPTIKPTHAILKE